LPEKKISPVNRINRLSFLIAIFLVIEKAVVPIIKLIESNTLVHVDISFNTSNGREAAALVKKYMAEYPNLKQLVVLLKYILNHRGLNEVWKGKLPSNQEIYRVFRWTGIIRTDSTGRQLFTTALERKRKERRRESRSIIIGVF